MITQTNHTFRKCQKLNNRQIMFFGNILKKKSTPYAYIDTAVDSELASQYKETCLKLIYLRRKKGYSTLGSEKMDKKPENICL